MLLPKCYRDATNVKDVYKIEDIFISEDLLKSVTEISQSVIDNCTKESNKEYVLNYFYYNNFCFIYSWFLS